MQIFTALTASRILYCVIANYEHHIKKRETAGFRAEIKCTIGFRRGTTEQRAWNLILANLAKKCLKAHSLRSFIITADTSYVITILTLQIRLKLYHSYKSEKSYFSTVEEHTICARNKFKILSKLHNQHKEFSKIWSKNIKLANSTAT